MTKHFILPDVQCKPGVPLDHLTWAGKYCAEKKPDVIVCLGDFADMPSLSSYDVGKKSFEGRKYVDDIEIAHKAMDLFLAPIKEEQNRLRKNKEKGWYPRFVLTLGNHEDRISRAVNEDRKLEGLINISDLPYGDWEVYPYLKPITVDGVNYCHYFCSGVLGRPVTSARMLNTKKHQSCVMGHVQRKEIDIQYKADGRRITSIFAGCLTPDHKVLTSDLRYVPIGEIKEGDTLISFDENPDKRKRRFKTGTVLKIKSDIDDVYQIKLESGKIFKVTKDHQWLVKTGSNYNWRTTSTLQKGTCIPKFIDEWEDLNSFEAGWLSGMYDGEGSLYTKLTSGGCIMQLAISQKEGLVLDKIEKTIFSLFGLTSNSWTTKGTVKQLRINGGAIQIAKVLGQIRPIRLLSKFVPEHLGSITCPDYRNDKVESILYLGKQEIIRSLVDEGTYIAEGYPHHNSYYQHYEDYLNPQGNANSWQGVWMLHEVADGSFDELPISLEFLKKRYG